LGRSDLGTVDNIFNARVDAGGEMEFVVSGEYNRMPCAWSPDGCVLPFVETSLSTGDDIWMFSRDEKARAIPFAKTEFGEWGPTFSPDGRCFAYASNESGQDQVHLEPFPRTGNRWQISTEGAESPLGSGRENELVHQSGGKLVSIEESCEPTFRKGRPSVLFEGEFLAVLGRHYSMGPNEDWFALLKNMEAQSGLTQLNVVTGFFEELKRKIPAGN